LLTVYGRLFCLEPHGIFACAASVRASPISPYRNASGANGMAGQSVATKVVSAWFGGPTLADLSATRGVTEVSQRRSEPNRPVWTTVRLARRQPERPPARFILTGESWRYRKLSTKKC
jgi:hypothetical protein